MVYRAESPRLQVVAVAREETESDSAPVLCVHFCLAHVVNDAGRYRANRSYNE